MSLNTGMKDVAVTLEDQETGHRRAPSGTVGHIPV